VECAHCGFKQVEYAAAKSSICRQCGHYFSPFAPKTGLKLHAKEEARRSGHAGEVVHLSQV